jgi:hypothetical protein
MFAKNLRLIRIELAVRLLALQIALLGLKVWARERAYHAIIRHAYRMGAVMYAVDPENEDVKALIDAAVAEATDGLIKKNRELLTEVRNLKKGDKADPAELDRLEAEVERLKTELTAANKSVKDLTKRAETAEKTLETEQSYTQRLLVDNGLAAALTEAGVTSPTMHKAAAALIRTGNKIDIAVDGDARVAKVGDKALSDFVKAWAQGDEGKAFVAAPGNGGGGAPGNGKTGGGAVNPWNPQTRDMTAQGKLFNENPALARQMAAEHGVTIAE